MKTKWFVSTQTQYSKQITLPSGDKWFFKGRPECFKTEKDLEFAKNNPEMFQPAKMPEIPKGKPKKEEPEIKTGFTEEELKEKGNNELNKILENLGENKPPRKAASKITRILELQGSGAE